MARSEWSELLRVLDASAHQREPDASLLAFVMQSLRGGERLDTSFLPRVQTGRVGTSALPLSFPSDRETAVVSRQSVSQPVRDDGSGNTLSDVMKTVGTVTGVGPLVTGLMKLFGRGGSDGEPVSVPELPYSLPEQISVEAGLAADRSFVPVTYSQGGVSRSTMRGAVVSPSTAQVLVNVQAMDSRSFLDHSDDIARAVRDAMLRSHSLNDVVAEM